MPDSNSKVFFSRLASMIDSTKFSNLVMTLNYSRWNTSASRSAEIKLRNLLMDQVVRLPNSHQEGSAFFKSYSALLLKFTEDNYSTVRVSKSSTYIPLGNRSQCFEIVYGEFRHYQLYRPVLVDFVLSTGGEYRYLLSFLDSLDDWLLSASTLRKGFDDSVLDVHLNNLMHKADKWFFLSGYPSEVLNNSRLDKDALCRF